MKMLMVAAVLWLDCFDFARPERSGVMKPGATLASRLEVSSTGRVLSRTQERNISRSIAGNPLPNKENPKRHARAPAPQVGDTVRVTSETEILRRVMESEDWWPNNPLKGEQIRLRGLEGKVQNLTGKRTHVVFAVPKANRAGLKFEIVPIHALEGFENYQADENEEVFKDSGEFRIMCWYCVFFVITLLGFPIGWRLDIEATPAQAVNLAFRRRELMIDAFAAVATIFIPGFRPLCTGYLSKKYLMCRAQSNVEMVFAGSESGGPTYQNNRDIAVAHTSRTFVMLTTYHYFVTGFFLHCMESYKLCVMATYKAFGILDYDVVVFSNVICNAFKPMASIPAVMLIFIVSKEKVSRIVRDQKQHFISEMPDAQGQDTFEFFQELTRGFPHLWGQADRIVSDNSGPKYWYAILVALPTLLCYWWDNRFTVENIVTVVADGSRMLPSFWFLDGLLFSLFFLYGSTRFFVEVERSLRQAWANIDQLLTLQSTITGCMQVLPLDRQQRIQSLRRAALVEFAQPPPAWAEEDSQPKASECVHKTGSEGRRGGLAAIGGLASSALSQAAASEVHIAGLRQLDLGVKKDLLMWEHIRRYLTVDFADETMFADQIASYSSILIAMHISFAVVVYLSEPLHGYYIDLIVMLLVNAAVFTWLLLQSVNLCIEINETFHDDIHIIAEMRWKTLLGDKGQEELDTDVSIIKHANLLDAMEVRFQSRFEPQKLLGMITMTSSLKYSILCSTVTPLGAYAWKLISEFAES